MKRNRKQMLVRIAVTFAFFPLLVTRAHAAAGSFADPENADQVLGKEYIDFLPQFAGDGVVLACFHQREHTVY